MAGHGGASCSYDIDKLNGKELANKLSVWPSG